MFVRKGGSFLYKNTTYEEIF